MSRRVAIVGAGIAGLTCARALKAQGWAPVLFDKARGPGGRIPTRRREGFAFDHGAPFFTAKGSAFRAEVERWEHAGAAASWTPRSVHVDASGAMLPRPDETVWLGAPRMSAIGRHLSERVDVRLTRRILRIERTDRGWTLHDQAGDRHGGFEALVLAIPPAQVDELLRTSSGSFRFPVAASARALSPRWSVLLGFDAPFDPGFDVATFETGTLERAIRNEAKPGRAATPAWVVHADPTWSSLHREAAPASVAGKVERALRTLLPSLPRPVFRDAHRWLYAIAREPGRNPDLPTESGLFVGGDWTRGACLEDAFESGRELAGMVAGTWSRGNRLPGARAPALGKGMA